MPKATFKFIDGERKTAGFKTPRQVGDLQAWWKAAIKALDLQRIVTENYYDTIVDSSTIIFCYEDAALVIDRKFNHQLSGRG